MFDWNSETGWARHSTFGLRREWLDLYLSNPRRWRDRAILGNRQVESLAAWLKTADIEDCSGDLTPLGKRFAAQGTSSRALWELLWVNVVFGFPPAHWYVHLGLGERTTTELRSLLQTTIPRLAERTVSNAIVELVGLLERTPIGDELGQGKVRETRPRRVIRCGVEPCDAAIVHALGRLYLRHGQDIIHFDSDLTWPWVVFGCSRRFVLERLTIIDQDCFDIDEHGVTIRIQGEEWWQCGDTMNSLL